MIDIILKHLASYPRMQLQDIAKLLYQSEFGGGHMIADAKKSLGCIRSEFESLKDSPHSPIIETIGDGMCRIYLSCLNHGMTAEVLNEIFVQCANHKEGSIANLEKKIELFLGICEKNETPYRIGEANHFFADWKKKGYPMMRHSEIYRETYQPAYRVIEESYIKVYNVIQMIEKAKRPLAIAIDGMSAGGKTTLGELLKKNYPKANLFHMDAYFLRPSQRTEKRMEEVGGNLDYERFKAEITDHLTDENGFKYRSYDCLTQTLGNERYVPQSSLNIIEGVYSQHPYFGDPYDIRLFCEISKEEQETRILKRNGSMMLKRFQDEWIPKENQYFETYEIKEKSECV